MGDSSFEMGEKLAGRKLPDDFKAFMIANGGLSHYERIFISDSGTEWEVHTYLSNTEFYDLTKEFAETYTRKMVPFAMDPGGWHFCLCVEEDDFGAVYVNRWTDYPPEEQFLKIADSFEAFINGLRREEV